MRFNRDLFYSPAAIFAGYMIIACLCILGFRFIFPGEISPLPVFSRNWHFIQGVLTILKLFPALAFSALVIPFGIAASDENYIANSKLPVIRRLTPQLMTAICAAVLYALLFFLALPLAENYERNLRYKGEIYRLAKERAQVHEQAGEWLEVSQFIGICDSVWKNSPELAGLRGTTEINLEALRFTANAPERMAEKADNGILSDPLTQRKPVNAADAIALSETAFNEGHLLDAHWLATLGRRVAKPGSPEAARAADLAAQAWNRIETQQPTSSETSIYSLYRLKLSGYEAMIAGDWIRAYYIFKKLLELTPDDPDVEHFLADSEKGTKESAFFIDEMEISLSGETLTGTIFSLPANSAAGQGRLVLRADSLTFTPDYAYGIGIEYMIFDSDARPLLSLRAPYAKILPKAIDNQAQVVVLMRTLDRQDPSRRWEPEWSVYNDTRLPADAQIVLNVRYEDFVMLSEMRQGLSSLHIDSLFEASHIAADMGYIPEVYEAEILNRLGSCLFLLPMAVFIIIIGWRFRARHRPHYLFVLLLPVLPLIFNGMAYLYRTVLNTIGISLILSLGFSAAFSVFIAILALSFIFSLILLAAQQDKTPYSP